MSQADSSASPSPFAEELARLDDRRRFGPDPGSTTDPPVAEGGDLDERLRQGVDCLRLLDDLLAERHEPEAGADSPDRRIGRFTIVRELGRGGFGVVYLARDPLLGRDVALKLPRPEALLTPSLRARFLREARAAAVLDHPGVIPVHETGEIGPLVYIASAYCDGPDLRQWLRGQAEPVAPRLAARLVAEIARAVQHAHDRGVLHRDLKPSNILLHGSTPRVTDFGLARFIEQELEESRNGLPIGSPSYMAPEQAAGRNDEVDRRTDVYALGAVLYELLVGQPPFRGESSMDTIRRVLADDPARPRLLRPGLPRALETIVLKCLEKSAGARYTSARELADDLDRFLEGRPILARPASPPRRALAWARRRPAAATLVVVSTLALVGLLWETAWRDAINRRHNRELAEALLRTQRHADDAEAQRAVAQRHLAAASVRLAGEALDRGETERSQEILGQVDPVDRTFAWRYLHARAGREIELLWTHQSRLQRVVLSSDGRTLAAADEVGAILLAPADGSGPPRKLAGHRAVVDQLAFFDEDRMLASVPTPHHPDGGEVRLWDVATGRMIGEIGGLMRGGTRRVACYAGGRRLAVASNRDGGPGELLLFELIPGPEWSARLLRRFETVLISELDPRGRLIPAAVARDRLALIDPATGEVRHTLETPTTAFCAVLSPDGARVAAKCEADLVVWDVPTGRRRVLFRAVSLPFGLHFSPDGARLAALTAEGRMRVRELATDREVVLDVATTGNGLPSVGVAFTPDGLGLVTGSSRPGASRQLALWDLNDGRQLAAAPGREAGEPFVLSPDGSAVFSGVGRALRLWRPSPPARHDTASHPPEAWAVAYSPDGRMLASGGDDNAVRLWDAATLRPTGTLAGHESTVAALAFQPGGRLLASASLGDADNLILWDVERRREHLRLGGHRRRIRAVAFSPDGSTLASASWDGTVRLWDVARGRCLRILEGHADRVRDVAFRPDGKVLASAGEDRRVRLWDVATGATVRVFPCLYEATAVRYTPDGTGLAWSDGEGGVTVWDLGRDVVRFNRSAEEGELMGLAFSPDGAILATAGTSCNVRLWDIASGQELLSLPCKARVNGVAFSPDGQTLAGCDLAGGISFWRASGPSR